MFVTIWYRVVLTILLQLLELALISAICRYVQYGYVVKDN